jgi:hypothetical protein
MLRQDDSSRSRIDRPLWPPLSHSFGTSISLTVMPDSNGIAALFVILDSQNKQIAKPIIDQSQWSPTKIETYRWDEIREAQGANFEPAHSRMRAITRVMNETVN